MALDKYFKPTSVTWWAALALLAHGILTKDVGQVIEAVGGIGLRGAIQ